MKPSPARLPMQVVAFVRKEIADVVHQPRLLLTLVLGPFLVLAAFGAGYDDSARPMTTMFVAAEDSPVRAQIDAYAEELSDFVVERGITSDPAIARRALAEGDVDLVVIFPDDPVGSVLDGEPATVTVVHTRLDPIERTAIFFATELAIGEINSQILAAVVGEGQELAGPATDAVETGHAAVSMMRDAIESGSDEDMAAAVADLDAVAADLRVAARASRALVERLGRGEGDDASAAGADLEQAMATMERAVRELRDDPTGFGGERLDELDRQLDQVATGLAEFAAADPDVLVRPLDAEVTIAVEDVDDVADWYAPAAVILMLQQFGIAFGSLTFVRERQLGITDVFRVAPVGAPATVIGKYLAYLAMGLTVGVVLMTAVVALLDVPLSGEPLEALVVMALTLFASIGVGFVISLASRSDAQAVQYTMIVLLASLFFSGFFLSSEQLHGPARAVGWLLPVTYGMRLLRDVMLRGTSLDAEIVLAFAGYGVAALALSIAGASRRTGVIRRA
jgi:ABC-2 type transport system permease protein